MNFLTAVVAFQHFNYSEDEEDVDWRGSDRSVEGRDEVRWGKVETDSEALFAESNQCDGEG